LGIAVAFTPLGAALAVLRMGDLLLESPTWSLI
jgi:hypothetical protein